MYDWNFLQAVSVLKSATEVSPKQEKVLKGCLSLYLFKMLTSSNQRLMKCVQRLVKCVWYSVLEGMGILFLGICWGGGCVETLYYIII